MSIQFENIHKRYPDGKAALSEINLRLEPNRIYGLLGRNGAGKTTLMHLLTGQLLPTSGRITVNGQNPFEHEELLQNMCFVKESQPYRKNLKIRDLFKLAAYFYPSWDQKFAERLIRDFDLDTRKKMNALSRGMESAVGIIIGLASRAPITIYDEPYLGLDAVARKVFYDRLLADFMEHPRTIIMSTHLIDEVSKLFEHVVMIHQGSIMLDEEVDSILSRAYFINGNKDQIAALATDSRILHVETLGVSSVASWFGTMSSDEYRKLTAQGFTISDMPLQQVLVQLTTDRKEEILV